jgi:hypothetical protein
MKKDPLVGCENMFTDDMWLLWMLRVCDI